MKCAVIESPGVLKIEEREIPKAKGKNVLIKVGICGICGTDLHIFKGGMKTKYPYSPGHEYTGIIVGKGEDVTDIDVGERVAVNPNYHCGRCDYCISGRTNHCENRKNTGIKSNGGMAEYVSVHRELVYRIDDLDLKTAVFTEPLSCVLHMIKESSIKKDEQIVIIGGGTMGLLNLIVCKRYFSGEIILSEPVKSKRNLASELGADFICDPKITSLSDLVWSKFKCGADIVFDNVGNSSTIKQAYNSLGKKRRLIISGLISNETAVLPIPLQDMVMKETEIKGIFLNPGTFQEALNISREIASDLKTLVTNEFDLTQIQEAFSSSSKEDSIKTIIRIS